MNFGFSLILNTLWLDTHDFDSFFFRIVVRLISRSSAPRRFKTRSDCLGVVFYCLSEQSFLVNASRRFPFVCPETIQTTFFNHPLPTSSRKILFGQPKNAHFKFSDSVFQKKKYTTPYRNRTKVSRVCASV